MTQVKGKSRSAERSPNVPGREVSVSQRVLSNVRGGKRPAPEKLL